MSIDVQEKQMIQEIQNWVESLEHEMSWIMAGRENILLFYVNNVITSVVETESLLIRKLPYA